MQNAITVTTKALTAVRTAFKTAAAAEGRANAARAAALTKLADEFRTAGLKAADLGGNAKTNAARGQIKGLFDKLVEQALISKASAATYQTCFWISFEKNVPFSTDLANQKSTAKKTEAKTDEGAKGKADKPKAKNDVAEKAQTLGQAVMALAARAAAEGKTTFSVKLQELAKEAGILK
jgi:hypothetical protein